MSDEPVSKPISRADLLGRTITGVIGERTLPDLFIEGGPGLKSMYPWSERLYGKSDLVYWHLNQLSVEIEGLGWIEFKWGYGFEGAVARPDEGWYLHGEGASWRVSSIDAPPPLAALVGATISGIAPLYYSRPARARRWWPWAKKDAGRYDAHGQIFETTKGRVAIADMEPTAVFAIGEWPGDKGGWEALGFVTEVDPRRVPRSRRT